MDVEHCCLEPEVGVRAGRLPLLRWVTRRSAHRMAWRRALARASGSARRSAAPDVGQSRSPALADIIGARRVRTAAIISLGSVPCRLDRRRAEIGVPARWRWMMFASRDQRITAARWAAAASPADADGLQARDTGADRASGRRCHADVLLSAGATLYRTRDRPPTWTSRSRINSVAPGRYTWEPP
jgi:hypothetical protein